MGGLVMDESDFSKLKSVDRDTLIYKNLLNQNTRIGTVETKLQKLSVIKLIGTIWLFILTVVMGLRRFLPI